jgi:hypothetical protein
MIIDHNAFIIYECPVNKSIINELHIIFRNIGHIDAWD